jgi:mono/diheme cytochrome c family protein
MRDALLVGCLVMAIVGLFVVGTFASRAAGGEAVETTNVVEPSNVSASSAAELYTKHCASCHGKDGRSKTFKAKSNHARNLTDAGWQERVSEERIFNSIMNGKGKMPGYGEKLSEQEIDLLVAYVRGLRK